MIGKGTRKGAKALLVDARPNSKYLKGTIPSSLNIPDTKFDIYYGQIAKMDKKKEVIVFCVSILISIKKGTSPLT